MDRRMLWSKILVAIALILMVRGWVPILDLIINKTSLTVGHGSAASFLLLGNILAFIGAILSKSSLRKLVLWGEGGIAAGIAFGIARVTYAAFTDRELPVPPIFISAVTFSYHLVQLVIIVGAILIVLERKRSTPPLSPSS
jgi:hypothetical protein